MEPYDVVVNQPVVIDNVSGSGSFEILEVLDKSRVHSSLASKQ